MPNTQQFIETQDKAAFILSAKFDNHFYTEVNKLSKENRQLIAANLVANRDQYDFEQLMLKMIDLCYEENGSEFVRKGSSDFLADILQSLALETDGKAFYEQCKRAKEANESPKECAFPASYQLSAPLQAIFALIQMIGNKFAIDKNDSSYHSNLGQNLANKVFFPILTNSGDKEGVIPLLTPFVKWAKNKPQEVQTYLDRRIPDDAEKQTKINDYFIKKNKHHYNAIHSIKNLIQNGQWKVLDYGLFSGGVTTIIDNKKIKVPNRVAAMAKLIDEYEQSGEKLDKSCELYEEIRKKAQEALNNPGWGQKQSTKDFYNNVLDNIFIAEHMVTVEPQDNAEHRCFC